MSTWLNRLKVSKLEKEEAKHDTNSSRTSPRISFELRKSSKSRSTSRSPIVISRPTDFVHVEHALPTVSTTSFEPLQLSIHSSPTGFEPLSISALSTQGVEKEIPAPMNSEIASSVASVTKPVPMARIATVLELDRMISSSAEVSRSPETTDTNCSMPTAIYLERAVTAIQESDNLDRQLKQLQDRIVETRDLCGKEDVTSRDEFVKRALKSLETRPHTPPPSKIVPPKKTPMRPSYDRQHTFGPKVTQAPLLGDYEDQSPFDDGMSPPSPMTAQPPRVPPKDESPCPPLPRIVLAPSLNAARPPLLRQNSSDHIKNWLLNSTSSTHESREIEVEASDIFGNEATSPGDKADKESIFSYAVRGTSHRGNSVRWSLMSDESRFTLEHNGTPPLLSDLDDTYEWDNSTLHVAEPVPLYHTSSPSIISFSRSTSAPSVEEMSTGTGSTPDSPVSTFQEHENESEWNPQTALKSHTANALGMFEFVKEEERRGSFGQPVMGRVDGQMGTVCADVGLAL